MCDLRADSLCGELSVVRFEIAMPPSFDVRLDDLTGPRVDLRGVAQDPDPAFSRTEVPLSENQASPYRNPFSQAQSAYPTPLPTNGDTFFIETFGCQMNAHD